MMARVWGVRRASISAAVRVKRARVDVGEDDPSAGLGDRHGGRNVGVGGGEDVVAGADASGKEGEVEGGRAGADADGERLADVLGEGPLEGEEFGAECEAAAVDDAGDGGVDVGFEVGVFGAEVEHGDGH